MGPGKSSTENIFMGLCTSLKYIQHIVFMANSFSILSISMNVISNIWIIHENLKCMVHI